MKKTFPIGMAAAWWIMSWQVAAAVAPTADELAKSREWAAARFETGAEPFFSFVSFATNKMACTSRLARN